MQGKVYFSLARWWNVVMYSLGKSDNEEIHLRS